MKKRTKGTIDRKTPKFNEGLNDADVLKRKAAGYVNISKASLEKSAIYIIFKNTFTFFNLILFSIAVLFFVFISYLYSIGRSDVVNTHFGFSKFGFLIPAIMNVIVGTFQEFKSRKTIRKLKIISDTKIKVVRNSKELVIEKDEVVVDDIIILSPGEQASVDLRVVYGEVYVDESMLTGESDYVKKKIGDPIYSGSAIMVGDARAIVTEVGDDTYAAKLSEKCKQAQNHKSELMESIVKIIKFLSVLLVMVMAIIVISMTIKISKYGNNSDIWDGMTLSISSPVTWSRIMIAIGSFGVGIIPSGLILTTSVALMLSVAGLSKQETLVQELYSLENLSRVDVICLDKTGTLTDGSMLVSNVKYFIDENHAKNYLKDIIGRSESKNQTGEALYNEFGENKDIKFKEYLPFSSVTKYQALIYENDDKLMLGAPDYLLAKDDKNLEYVNEQSKDGKRVLALVLNDKLVSLISLEDHIRKSAIPTLKYFDENGVTVKVISGDNPVTVSKIASLCGIKNSDKYISLEGVPLEKIPEICEEYTIFARVSPEQKEALVDALKAKKHKVAMTGDGVNDILALKKANTSITFAKATEAAKACSDVILLDNDFSHLKNVVEEGRRVVNNVQKLTVLFLMKAIAIILTAIVCCFFKKGQFWYSIENAYMLEATAIGTGGFLLSLDKENKEPIKGSFIKNITLKAICAGLIAFISIIIPIMFYLVPIYFEFDPLISAVNVRTMITLLLTDAGLAVLFSLCIPLNKARLRTLILTILVALSLTLMLPTSYVGGRPTGADLFQYNKAAGETVFNSQFFHEFIQPWNSVVVREIWHEPSDFLIFGLFFIIIFPTFYGLLKAIDVYIYKDYDLEATKKELKELRKLRREAFRFRRQEFRRKLRERREKKNK